MTNKLYSMFKTNGRYQPNSR